MGDDSEQEFSDLEIQRRTWDKLERNMKSIGFREGATKGKNLSLQEGFNSGYLDGFKMGKNLGAVKAIMICKSKLNLASNANFELDEKTINNLSSQICVLCSKVNSSEKSVNEKIFFKKFEDLVSAQQSHCNIVHKNFKKLNSNDLKSDFNNA